MGDGPAEVRAWPILPVVDVDRALAHYAALGFLTRRWSEDYCFAAGQGLEIHLSLSVGHDALRTASAVFLHVADPDSVHAPWSAAGAGRDIAPEDEPWHVREGAHIDDDGNLLRSGGPIASES